MCSSYLNRSGSLCWESSAGAVNTPHISAPDCVECAATAALASNPGDTHSALMAAPKWHVHGSNSFMLRLEHATGLHIKPLLNASMWGVHHRVNMDVSGQVLTLAMPVFISGLHTQLHPIFWLPTVPNTCVCVAKQLSGSHSWSPVSTATFNHPGRQTTLPGPPTHSVNSIQETTNTPTNPLPQSSLV